MIYTVTFNPSLDYIVRVNNFRPGVINRTFYEKILPGGKGINVSIVVSSLGHDSIALGFMAGFTGEDIEELLKGFGCGTDFIRVKEGFSRINVKMRSDEETEINGQGPKITDENIEALYAQLDKLQAGDILIISGSVPNTLPGDMYERIMSRLEGRGIDIVVDAEKDLLVNVLKYHPFLIKPNNHELGDIYGVTLKTKDEVVPYAKKLQEEGARNVLISMAGEGAVFISEKGDVMKSEAPKGTVVNSVGAGDSMVAGFVTGMIESNDYMTAFRMGLCTGSASAFSPDLATRPEVEALLEKLPPIE
jgi:1-phosphofructokinase